MISSESAVIYRLDDDYRIAEVNDAWRDFALSNGGDALADGVVGRPVWDLVHDEGIRLIYEILIDDVRLSGIAASFPFRCDGLRHKRHQHLIIEPAIEGGVRFVVFPVRIEESDPGEYWYTQVANPVVRTICRDCARVYFDHAWVAPSTAVCAMDLFNEDHRVYLRPGQCHSCSPESAA